MPRVKTTTQVEVNTMGVAKALLRCTPSTVTSQMLTHLQDGRILEALKTSINPAAYSSPWEFAIDYQAVCLLSKSEFLDIGVDKRASALAKWKDAEETCSIVNQFGRTFTGIRGNSLERVIQRARSIIFTVLGRLDLNEIYDRARFGGGATTSTRRKHGHPAYKYQRKLDVTPDAFPYAVAAVRADQQWFYAMVLSHGPSPHDWFKLVAGNKMGFVPKNWKTERIICPEADANILLQVGVGSTLKKRLRRHGIDLSDQTRNQRLARKGSIDGTVATLDLSSASDTIALELVRDLLPYDWFKIVCDLRSPYTLLPDGTYHRNQKVSSMGNGFTFELESLIFYAMARAVCEEQKVDTQVIDEHLSVYGDDIIIPTQCVELMRDVLQYTGFTLNDDKSFWDGPFRESCGKHYFMGADVTPVFMKRKINCVSELYRLVNALDHSYLGPLYEKTLKWMVRFVPSKLRFLVPKTFGLRAGFWSERHGSCAPRVKNGVYRFTYMAHIQRSRQPSGWSGLHYSLGYCSEESMAKIKHGEGYISVRKGSSFSMH